MTTSFPVTKTGLRFGLATALVGCLALALIAGPGRAADDPVLAKVNGAEIKKSDVAMAEEELGASLAHPWAGDSRREDNASFGAGLGASPRLLITSLCWEEHNRIGWIN